MVGHFLAGPITESKGLRVDKKGQKKGKKRLKTTKKVQNIWKFRQKFTKFETILKKV